MKPIFTFATMMLVGCGKLNSVDAQGEPSAEIKERRVAALKKYDQDSDGKLSDAERESMRKDRFAERLRDARAGRGGFRWTMPPEIVKKYDQDGDGQLNEDEEQAAREGLRRQMEEMQKKYDKNGNGVLEEEEMETLRKDAEEGKIEGVPRFFGRRGPWGGGRPGSRRDEVLKKADQNGDGRLSDAELQAARKELEQQPTESEK